jgi:hypothetical protein
LSFGQGRKVGHKKNSLASGIQVFYGVCGAGDRPISKPYDPIEIEYPGDTD